MIEEVGPDAADLDEGSLERREAVRLEEVGAAAVGAEVDRLVPAGRARGYRGRKAPAGEEDIDSLGAARAVGLRSDASHLGLVRGGGRAATGARGGGLPLTPLLDPPVRRRRGDGASGRGPRGALGGGEGGGGARGCAGEATPPEKAGHGGG